ncbi:monofunctional biosynthetic peptidoglycan transglycosylase [Pasteurella oralis]|uniref:Biosynthetic peptidoglycan transglycosylase n=1 Tax=Pasteurella oralis TaxID=1071947 RepID=A0ABW4NVJ8_9PAST|nr:monofunctional biosynthetic peptidoglycan transglycosylase [Pasteurella oralis]MDO5054088.1 monofunctional biosynthetic peptidoglycan transglycosylase [Pasteurella oralis]
MSKQKKIKRTFPFLSCWQQIKPFIYRIFAFFLFGLVTCTLLFRVVPVPFSAYMVQKKLGHLLQGNFDYQLNYQWISLDNIAWQMQLAVIASEDQLFPAHNGFDWHAIQTALQHNKSGKTVRGGSTISQQTAKNLYLWHGQSWLRKGIEVPTTFVLETLWSKKRILEVYLNIAEFGQGIFGVEAASQHYFAKPAKYLTQTEAALLAAVLPNPIIFKVDKPSAYVKRKQMRILRQMNLLGKRYLDKLD